jgi:hypothetical protein
MKKKVLFGFVVLGLWAVLGSAIQTQVVPLAVSPGSERGLAVVGQACPTFSWTAVDWALGYRVAVFQAFGTVVPGYEEMAMGAVPVLSKEIAGRAFSWTPSSEERLSTGSLYVWYVQAMGSSGQGVWSNGKLFMIEAGGWTPGLEGRVRSMLKEKGVRDEVIDDLLKETSFGLQSGILTGAVPGSVGKTPGKVGTQGSEGPTNTFYGQYAGASTTGTYNTFLGAYAGYYNTTGYQNTFLGQGAGFYNSTGPQNVFVGQQTGVSNVTGYYNTMVGTYAGYYNTTGYYNTFMGQGAGFLNTTGRENTFIGVSSGISNTTGRYNTFLGKGAGYANTTANSNTFMGYNAGYANTANYNTFVGGNAGDGNTTGDYNTFLGYSAGTANTTGRVNVFVGPYAGMINTTGQHNTFVGGDAGEWNVTGSNNVFLGSAAGYNETGSNKLYIDCDTTSTPLIYGDFSANYLRFNGKVGFSVTPATYPIEVSGGAYCTGTTWVSVSGREYKENIETLTSEDALAAFRELEPVKFNYKTDKEEQYLGFIAEDVPELVAMKDRKGLNTMDVVAVLTKVVQEQQKEFQKQQKTIEELQGQIAELKRKVKSEK